jgi:hypothetical protein
MPHSAARRVNIGQEWERNMTSSHPTPNWLTRITIGEDLLITNRYDENTPSWMTLRSPAHRGNPRAA